MVRRRKVVVCGSVFASFVISFSLSMLLYFRWYFCLPAGDKWQKELEIMEKHILVNTGA